MDVNFGNNKEGKKPLRVLLIGFGRFGKKHLHALQILEKNGDLVLVGVVVKEKEQYISFAQEKKLVFFTEITKELLSSVDAVDIVTPPETHVELVKQCLPYANVFVEKPLAENSKDAHDLVQLAKQHNHLLMVGHIFRFHPVTIELKSILDKNSAKLERVVGQYTNSLASDPCRDPSLEMLHYYDILDFLFEGTIPTVVTSEQCNRVYKTSLRYPNVDALLTIGWVGEKKVRTLDFFMDDKIIKVNFEDRTIDTYKDGEMKRQLCNTEIDPLTEELKTFVFLVKDQLNIKKYPTGEVGLRIVDIADKARPRALKNKRPSVAIIGAGIFGINCALEVGKFADVTIFERNSDILSEASFVNQYRHHWGYHYPRSSETVRDILEATADFEKMYNEAIIRDFPTYYGVAKEGSKVNGTDYIKFCNDHCLPFSIEYPDEKFLAKDKMEVCLKTLEPIYDYFKLKSLAASYVVANGHIKIKLNSRVTDTKINSQGEKIIIFDQNGNTQEEVFDYVINVTYANFNQFSHWLGFPKKAIRLDVVEALIVELPVPRISLAVMDGPFTNLVPTGQDNIFTLVHIKESILKRFVPSDGLVPPGLKMDSNAKNIIEKSQEWFPILSEAKLLESRYVYRSVNANREHDDARPSDIVYLGFGCWSILGGKILNSVTIAQKIAREILGKNA